MEQPAKRPRLRFSIRGVLLATALVAVAAAPVGWLGPIYGINAAVSLALLGGVGWALPRKRAVSITVYCVAAVFASALLFSSGLFFQAVATLVIGWLGVAIPRWNRQVLAACVVVMFLAYLPAFRRAIDSDRGIDAMRENWPLVSIRSRLPRSEPIEEPVAIVLTSAQREGLEHLDKETERTAEFWLPLRRIHSASYKRFARSAGFGISRMGPVRHDRIELGDQWRRENDDARLPVRLSGRADTATPLEMHRVTQTAFLLRDRLGYVESPDRVAGFLGHGFGRLPFQHRSRWDEEPCGDGAWSINRLDLIGLVLHDEPKAYVSDELPNMEALRDAPTRSLEDFEAKALEAFGGKEDLVTEETISDGKTHVRMVGAIRAGESCAACHEVPFGTLLGAFSYDLTRLNPARSRPSAGG